MFNRASRAFRSAAPDAEDLDPRGDRRSGPVATLRRKVSSRLARHVALGRRRFDNPRPMVSFTFDDAATSAGVRGAEGLEKSGGRGTYYIATGLIGANGWSYALIDRDHLRDLHRAGHEIALHGHAHRAAGTLSAEAFRDDLAKNREWLEGVDENIRPTNFAYPYGFASFPRKRQLSRLVASSRSVAPGIIAGDFDPQFLRCVELADARLTPEMLTSYLDATLRSKGWLIFCSHDIAERPSPFGCTPGLFQRALDGVVLRGLEIVTIAAAIGRSRPI